MANPILGSEFKSMHVLVLGSGIASSLQPLDCSLPSSSVHGIFQSRILEWVATSSSKGSSWPRIKPTSPTLQVGSLPLSHQGSPRMCLKKFSCNSSEKFSVTHTFSLCSCPLLSQALCYTNKCMCLHVHIYIHRVRKTHWQKRKQALELRNALLLLLKMVIF